MKSWLNTNMVIRGYRGIYFIIISMFLFGPVIALADSGFLGSGFETSNANVQWCDSGVTHNGAVVWEKEDHSLVIWGDLAGTFWKISSAVDDVGNLYYLDGMYSTLFSTPATPTQTWRINSPDMPSGGTMTANSDCPFPPPPPPPPPSTSLSTLIDSATSTFATTTGFTFSDAVDWTIGNLLRTFMGTGIATLYTLRYWIASIIAILVIVGFAFRGMMFF